MQCRVQYELSVYHDDENQRSIRHDEWIPIIYQKKFNLELPFVMTNESQIALVAGQGGCPYAMKAGNVATSCMYMLQGMR